MRHSPGASPRRASRVTLARAISKSGLSSRTQARALVDAGRVRLNGRVAHSPDVWINPSSDQISIDGHNITSQRHVYFALHKPVGLITTRSDEAGRSTVYDLLPEAIPWVFPVGRLDKETSGLLLFTNDTRFGDLVTRPGRNVPKTYLVALDRPLAPSDAAQIRAGLSPREGTRYRPAKIEIAADDPGACRIVLTEGKNRQIRRMFDALGYSVRRLHRLSIGPVMIGTLEEGHTRPLTRGEISSLRGHFPGPEGR
ncbi:MAG TPA: pseudouridine synthase [Bacteroidota bacterium]|nr:pseudouridine synthase [Bacteroidota bacterium]